MAMSWIWVGLLSVSAFFAITGNCAAAVSSAALEGAAAGITLSISLAGALCLWSGLAKVMECSGLNRILAKLLSPLLRRLFPNASRDEVTAGCISANVTANLLGLGNAATPLGIEATKRMKAQSGSDRATDEMCRFIVMNTASIQLLPTTVASVRAASGASSPFDILPAVWVTSLCSVTMGLIAAFLLSKRWKS